MKKLRVVKVYSICSRVDKVSTVRDCINSNIEWNRNFIKNKKIYEND